MRDIKVKVHPSKSNLKKEDQLAWKIAEIASDKAKIDNKAVDMVINRIIDNASVAIASFNRRPVVSARAMALAHSRKKGATVFGLNPKTFKILSEFMINYIYSLGPLSGYRFRIQFTSPRNSKKYYLEKKICRCSLLQM